MPRPVALACGLLLLVVGSATEGGAHHSFSATYDFQQPVRITGVITVVRWTDPHVSFIMDVPGRKGQIATWELSADAATALTRRGVPEGTLAVGQTVRVDGFRARDGANRAAAGAVRLPGGRRVFVGPLEDPTPISRAPSAGSLVSARQPVLPRQPS